MNSSLRPILAAFLLVSLAACSKPDHDHAKAPAAGGHAHVAPHGGVLVEVGDHAYNLEFLRDAASGRLSVWVLDGHAENFTRIKAASLDLVATVGAEKRALTLKAVANPATGETVGDTSQFDVQADWLKTAPAFDGSVPALEIRGTKFGPIQFKLPASAK
jgi:hypothetical protein